MEGEHGEGGDLNATSSWLSPDVSYTGGYWQPLYCGGRFAGQL